MGVLFLKLARSLETIAIFSNKLKRKLNWLLLFSLLPFSGFPAQPATGKTQLQAYIVQHRLPAQVIQVDLNTYQAVSQYSPILVKDFGFNSCGLIASTQWLLSLNTKEVTPQQNLYQLDTWMKLILQHAVNPNGISTYQQGYGIQPDDLVQAVSDSGFAATGHNQWNLSEMYQALAHNRIVIVDLGIHYVTDQPSSLPPTIAHFARVLGIDSEKQVIYLENTLHQNDGRSYWEVSLDTFLAAWQYPEIRAQVKPRHVSNITQWAMVISP